MNSLERFKLKYEYQEDYKGQQLWRTWSYWRGILERIVGKWI